LGIRSAIRNVYALTELPNKKTGEQLVDNCNLSAVGSQTN